MPVDVKIIVTDAPPLITLAEAVMEAVRAAGRNPPTREIWSQHDPEIRDAVRAVIERTHRERPPRSDKT